MNLSGFHARVKRVLGRGDSLDTSIPEWVEEAVQEIENNKNFQYMKVWTEFTVNASATSPHVISLYGRKVKEVELLRYVGADGKFKDIKRINPKDRTTRMTGLPSGFWLNGLSSIILDSIPDENMDFEGHFVEYSSWQPDQDTYEHFLIDRHRGLLLSQTVLIANVTLRDPRLAQLYGPMNDRAWTLANQAEESIQYANPDAVMEYHPPFDEYDTGFTSENS